MIHRTGGIILTLIVPLDEAVPPPNQIDKDWLTTVLKRDGTLSAGGICDVHVDYLTSTNSHIARIRIEYDLGSVIR